MEAWLAALVSIVVSIVMALIYGGLMYLKVRGEEPFNKKKLLRTLVLAFLAGIFLWYSGEQVTEMSFDAAYALILTAGGGFWVVVVDQLLAWLWPGLTE